MKKNFTLVYEKQIDGSQTNHTLFLKKKKAKKFFLKMIKDINPSEKIDKLQNKLLLKSKKYQVSGGKEINICQVKVKL